MLRIIGSILVIGGCSGLGMWYRMELVKGIEHLRKLRELLEMLMSEISYHKSTLPEACRQVGIRLGEPYRSRMIKIHGLLNGQSDMDFKTAWRQEMGACLSQMPISVKEKEMVLGFAENGSLSDYQMQIRTIEQYRDMIDNSVKKRETEIQKQGKMATGLGVMGGLLLVVILF